jgi:archaellum component FlaC
MSIDIRIDSYDISDMEERLDRAFDIRNGWGAEAVTDDNVMASIDEVGHGYPLGSVQAVLQQQQATIQDQQRQIDRLILVCRRLETTVENVTDALGSVSSNLRNIK